MRATFGHFLQELLNELGISPTRLAAMMERTERTVYNWLQSTTAPRDAVALLSHVLDIPPGDLRRAAAGEQDLAPHYRDRQRWQAARARALRGEAGRELSSLEEDSLLDAPPAAPAARAPARASKSPAGAGKSPAGAGKSRGRRVGADPLAYLRERGISPTAPPAPAGHVTGYAVNYDARVDQHEETVSTFESVGAGVLGARDVEQLSAALGEAGRFKVRVRGQSMAPDFPDGCWVVFSRPRALAEGIVDNKDYLVWTTSDESTFKRVARDAADPVQYLILRPLNPDRHQYPDQRIHRRDVAYVARAVRKEIEIP